MKPRPLFASVRIFLLIFLFHNVCLMAGETSFSAEKIALSRRLGSGAFRHAGNITGAALLSDGKRVLTCGRDGTARIWDIQTGKEVVRFVQEKKEDVWGAVVLPGEKGVLTAGEDKKVTHWAAAYSADSREIFCACNNLLARFQASDGTRIFPATDSAVVLGGVWALAAVGGNETVYCANGSGKGIIVRNATTGKILTYLLKKRFVSTLALSQDRNFLLTEDGKEKAVLVDVKSGKTVQSFHHSDNVNDVAFALEAKVVISADDKKIAVWDRETGKMLRTLDGHNHNINGLRVNPRGEVAAACCEKGLLCLWKIETGKLLVKLEAGGRDFTDCDFHPRDRRSVLVACDDGLRYWHAGGTGTAGLSEAEIRKRIRQLGDVDFKVRESATTDLIKAGQAVLPLIKRVDSEDPEVMMRIERIRKNLTGRKIYKGKDGKDDKPALLEFKKPVSSVVFHPTGSWWAAVEGDGRADDAIVIGSIQDNKPVILRRIKSGQGPCSLHFSSDGTELFAGNRNSTVDVYSLKK